jgi:hypothetical protein
MGLVEGDVLCSHAVLQATSHCVATLRGNVLQTFAELDGKKGAPVQPWRFWNLLKTAYPQVLVSTPKYSCRPRVLACTE